MQKALKIYVDMDGVLADFNQMFELLFYVPANIFQARHGKDAFWDKVNSHPTFFEDIPPFAGVQTFWNSLWQYSNHVTVLTSPARSKTERCKKQKQKWVENNLTNPNGAIPFVIFEKNKYRYACPHSILIDDYDKKIDPWNEAGGYGVYHPVKSNFSDTLKTIDAIYRSGGYKK